MRVSGPAEQDAAAVVKAILHAMETGDVVTAFELFDPEVVYINTGEPPFEVRGRDAYVSFITQLQDLYTEPRSHEILGVEAYTPTMAAIRARVSVGDVSAFALMFHYVRDGRVVELIDVIEDRARTVAPYIDQDAMARLKAAHT